MRQLITLISLATLLSACANAPSPQDTQPTKAAKCTALRAEMMSVGHHNNTSSAVLDNEETHASEQYKNECE